LLFPAAEHTLPGVLRSVTDFSKTTSNGNVKPCCA
jgi:hypothetical protein